MSYRLITWETHQARTDGHSCSWVKLHKSIFENDRFIETPDEEKWIWFWLMSHAKDHDGIIHGTDEQIGRRMHFDRRKKFNPSLFIGHFIEVYGDSPVGDQVVTKRSPTGTPRREEKRREEKNLCSSAAPTGGGFDLFWNEYPRKVGKAPALKSWRSQKLDEECDKILESIRKCKNSKEWRKDDGQFIPHPATWLNQKRWEDEGLDPLPQNRAGGTQNPPSCPKCHGAGGRGLDYCDCAEGVKLKAEREG